MSYASVAAGRTPQSVGNDPGSTFYPGDVVQKQLQNVDTASLKDKFGSFLDAAELKFRSDVEADLEDIPELSRSESPPEDQPKIPEASFMNFSVTATSTRSAKPMKDPFSVGHNPNIGGAVVKNLCLVVPDKDKKRFADLPVMTVPGSSKTTPQLVASVPGGHDEASQYMRPLLLLPTYGKHGRSFEDSLSSNIAMFSSGNHAGMLTGGMQALGADPKVMLKSAVGDNLINLGGPLDMRSKESPQVAQTDLENYVISGDIEDFFGIRGLTAKLYQFKGPSYAYPGPSPQSPSKTILIVSNRTRSKEK